MSNQRKVNVKKLTQLSVLIAIIAVLNFTQVGFIKIPPISITILHIPVIIGGVVLGPLYGGVLGGAFGLMSMFEAMRSPNPADMVFSPFASGDPFGSIFIIVPRILLGVIAAYIYILIKKYNKNGYIAIPIAAIVATISHTIMVLGSLYFFFDALPLKTVFLAVGSINGIIEIISAAIIATLVCKPLIKIVNK